MRSPITEDKTEPSSLFERYEKKIPIAISGLSLLVAILSMTIAYSNYNLLTEDLSFKPIHNKDEGQSLGRQGIVARRTFAVSNTSNIPITLTGLYCSNLQVTINPRSFYHRDCKIISGITEMPVLIKAGESQLVTAEIEIVAAPRALELILEAQKTEEAGGKFWSALGSLAKAGIDIYDRPLPGGPDKSGAGFGMTSGQDSSILDLWYGTDQGIMFYAETARNKELHSPHFTFHTSGGAF